MYVLLQHAVGIVMDTCEACMQSRFVCPGCRPLPVCKRMGMPCSMHEPRIRVGGGGGLRFSPRLAKFHVCPIWDRVCISWCGVAWVWSGCRLHACGMIRTAFRSTSQVQAWTCNCMDDSKGFAWMEWCSVVVIRSQPFGADVQSQPLPCHAHLCVQGSQYPLSVQAAAHKASRTWCQHAWAMHHGPSD